MGERHSSIQPRRSPAMPLSPHPFETTEEFDPVEDASMNADVDAAASAAGHPNSAGRTGVGQPVVRLAGWYPDPRGRYDVRYFDGQRWTFRVGTVNPPTLDEAEDGAETVMDDLAKLGVHAESATQSNLGRNLLIGALSLFGIAGWGYGLTRPTPKPTAATVQTTAPTPTTAYSTTK
jgi:hypothetical protein